MRTTLISVIAVSLVPFLSCTSGEDTHGDDDSDNDNQTDGSGDADGDSDGDTDSDSDGDADADTDTDTDTDIDTDADSDSDGDADSDSDTDNLVLLSYIWISNTGEGTVSKVDTRKAVEVARYITSPLGMIADGDPSRTSVNRYGDAVVANRRIHGDTPASVTKYAADPFDCPDKNSNGLHDTSTGPQNVLPWNEDECMLWHTSLGAGVRAARALAWDGEESPYNGQGGHVWAGTCLKLGEPGAKDYVIKLNGDTGEIMEKIEFPGCVYGAAMGAGATQNDPNILWIVERNDSGNAAIHRIDTSTLAVQTIKTECGYGMAVDTKGRVWATGGVNAACVNRYDPGTGKLDKIGLTAGYFARGAGTGIAKSAGYVWTAESAGRLLKIDEELLTVTDAYDFGSGQGIGTIGIGIDYEGYVWIISQVRNEAYKYDPDTNTYVTVKVGTGPYTYSDMTGTQLYIIPHP